MGFGGKEDFLLFVKHAASVSSPVLRPLALTVVTFSHIFTLTCLVKRYCTRAHMSKRSSCVFWPFTMLPYP